MRRRSSAGVDDRGHAGRPVSLVPSTLVGWLRLLPFSSLALAVVIALIRVIRAKLSHVTITSTDVEIRNFPFTRRVPLPSVDRFDKEGREGVWSQLRRVSAVLILTDGSEVFVRSLGDPEVTGGLTGLNNQLAELRKMDRH